MNVVFVSYIVFKVHMISNIKGYLFLFIYMLWRSLNIRVDIRMAYEAHYHYLKNHYQYAIISLVKINMPRLQNWVVMGFQKVTT